MSAYPITALVLLTDGFGGFGGISKFNRDFLTALCSHPAMAAVIALPRLMPNDPGPLPANLDHNTTGLGGKVSYIIAVVRTALQLRQNCDESATRPLIFCGHINLLPAALLAKCLCGGDLHLLIHGIDAWEPHPSAIINRLVGEIDGFVAVSNVTKERFLGWTHLPAAKGRILPNCVDMNFFGPGPKPLALLDRYGLHAKKVLMTFGRLASEERYKGFDEVLNVLPSLTPEIPDLAYLICGDGPDRQRLEAKAQKLGIADRVVFAGRVSEAEKADHYRLADVYVMPSSGEGFGIVYLEALACGIPVIGSNADGSREALRDGLLGELVDPKSPPQIAAAILRALASRKPPERQVEAVSHFSFENYTKRLHKIIDDMTPATE